MKRRSILLFSIIFIVLSSFVSAADLVTNLVAYWNMDETSGTTIADINNIYNATGGATAISTGKIGYGRSFDGNDIMTSASGGFLPTKGAFCAWVNVTTFTANMALGKKSGAFTGPEININGASSRWQAMTYDGGANNPKAQSAQDSQLNEWEFICMTWDEVGHSIILYINGVVNATNGNEQGSWSGGSVQWIMGENSGFYYSGIMDEYGFWNDELSAEQISYLYNDGQGVSYPFVVNNPPNTPSPSLVSVDGTNNTNSDLNCSATISDPEGDSMNVSVQWFRNSTLYSSYSLNNNYANGTTVSHILSSGNLSINDSWICSMQATDGDLTSDWGNSTALNIIYDAYWTWTNITLSTNSGVRGEQFTVQVGVTCSSGTADCDGNAGTIHIDPKIFDNRIVTSDPWNYDDYWYVELL